MDITVTKRRAGTRGSSSVVAGSVWESRMKSDTDGEEQNKIKTSPIDDDDDNNKNKKSPSSPSLTLALSGKRKIWKEETKLNKVQLRSDPKGGSSKLNLPSGIKKIPVELRSRKSPVQVQIEKGRSDLVQTRKQTLSENVVNDLVSLRLTKSESFDVIERDPVEELRKTKSFDDRVKENDCFEIKRSVSSDENCKEFDVCQDKIIASSVNDDDNNDEEDCQSEEFEDKEDDEVEKKSIEVGELKIPEKFEISKPFSSSNVDRNPPPTIKNAYSKPKRIPLSDDHQNLPQTHTNLQNLVDLVMWRDPSKSAFIFGLGSFIIVSSSYTNDLNISFISVISYMGLVYLAAIFIYKSIICRGVIDIENSTRYVLGEEEAVWLLKLVLPYLNELLSKLKTLFSGDPATTMKLAVVLFVLARSGSSITIWKMAKLGFFGVFTLPKVCSSYSTQLTAYGKFWIRRFRDAWDSCSHKKGVAIAIFTIVWNLSSIVARAWAVFMLFVAVRYYQHSVMVRDTDMDTDSWDDAKVDIASVQRSQLHNKVVPNKFKKIL